ncbi:hypothetical protein OIU85_020854 [Salix viminalis]|uniref:Ferredoxin n=1 Tax=Salix viminalis TaxID=40686 RepID=A0A9Q0ZCX8_SALVM|nr:hypothetical protein OIU85_020854 [Salix viminalis]
MFGKEVRPLLYNRVSFLFILSSNDSGGEEEEALFFCCCEWKWIVLCQLLLANAVCASHLGNPANDLVDIINKNRTAQKLPELNDSPGLGCMALQYVELCKGNCTSNGFVNCKPPEDDFTEVFGPNCGVELPTFGTITGHIVGCQAKYLEASLAFSHVLVKDMMARQIPRLFLKITAKGSSKKTGALVGALFHAVADRGSLYFSTIL